MPWRARQRWSALLVSLGMASRRQPSTSSSGSKVRRRNSPTIASSASVSTVLRRRLGPIGASAVVGRLRHFRTVLGFNPYRAARARDGAALAPLGARLEHAASCGLSREDLLPPCILFPTGQRCTTTPRDQTPRGLQ